MESKSMTQYREIKVTVLALDNKDSKDDQQGWLYDAITDAIITSEGERITSFEIGQPFEK
tara:strand:- start:640 stop:819 length:180 start_codon:yes stop_codon:yes gene_type:complete